MNIKKTNNISYILMKKEYYTKINLNNIQNVSRYFLWKTFKKETKQNKNMYLRNLVSDWLKVFVGADESLFHKLKKIIKKTKINLTDIEKDELFVLEERAFSEIRQIKIIEVNYNLYKGENIGVKYTNANLYSVKRKTKKLYEGDLLISNKRIIFDGYNKFFRFTKMDGYSNDKDGLIIIMKNGEKYLIRIHDSKTINNTFNNIINRKVKNDIKKY